MNKLLLCGAAAALGLMASTAALAQTPAAPAAAGAAPAVGTTSATVTTTVTTTTTTAAPAKTKFSSASSLVDIMNNPAAKAAMAKTLPDLIPILEMYIDMIPPEATLDGLPDLSMGMVTEDQVKAINADLIKI